MFLENKKIVSGSFVKYSTLIKKFVDNDESRELACLDAVMHLVVNQLLAPSGEYLK